MRRNVRRQILLGILIAGPLLVQPACSRHSVDPPSHNTTGTSGAAVAVSGEPAASSRRAALGDRPMAKAATSASTAAGRQPPSSAAERSSATGTTSSPPPRARPTVQHGGETTDITFDDLKLDMPLGTLFETGMLTSRVRELDGRDVRLRGFIFAGGVFQSSGITEFPFVMNTQCKFGPQGLAYCVIVVELQDGVTTDFTTYPITVEGKLTVRPLNLDGFTWSVYHMRGTKVY